MEDVSIKNIEDSVTNTTEQFSEKIEEKFFISFLFDDVIYDSEVSSIFCNGREILPSHNLNPSRGDEIIFEISDDIAKFLYDSFMGYRMRGRLKFDMMEIISSVDDIKFVGVVPTELNSNKLKVIFDYCETVT